MKSKKAYDFHNERAKECAPTDFWGQIRRTVGGKPVDETQIAMIVDAVVRGLDINEGDVVLDLCCGNGALSDRIFDRCRGGLGVDFGEYLIDIAKQFFERKGVRDYALGDAEEFVASTSDTQRFTKALCYGSFAYLPDGAALIRNLHDRFPNVRRVFIGNLPDKSRIKDFYYEGTYVPGIENDSESPLGIWRSESEFADLAGAAGWSAAFSKMPAEFYASAYRYDVALKRK